MALAKLYLADKATVLPPVSKNLHVKSMMLGGPCLSVTQLLRVCGPLKSFLPARPLHVQLKPVSKIQSPDRDDLETELVDLIVNLPVHVSVTEEPRKDSVHVTPAEPLNDKVAEIDLPSMAIVPTKSDLGHLTLMPDPSVSTESADVPLLAPVGLMVACAGAVAANTLSIMTANATSRRERNVMVAFLSRIA